MVGSPGRTLSDVVTGLLKKADECHPVHVVNSYDFQSRVDGMTIEEGDVMFSADAISMFTSISITLVQRSLKKREDTFEKMGLNIGLVTRMVTFLLNDCAVFRSLGSFYRQKCGLAMGSPMSPILSKMVMTDLIRDTILREGNVMVKFFANYVDDGFGIADGRQLGIILAALNSYDDTLQFELEVEERGSLVFLDMLLTKDRGHIRTRWFQKPYATGKRLQWSSDHPPSMKKGIALTLARTTRSLTSVCFRKHVEWSTTRILMSNGYPLSIAMNSVRIARGKVRELSTTQPIIWRPLGYTRGIHSAVRQAITDVSTLCDIRLAPRPLNKIRNRSYACLKDSIPLEERKKSIVKIQCKGCDMFAIANTGKYGNVAGLIDEIRQTGALTMDRGILRHCVTTGHSLDPMTLKVVDKAGGIGDMTELTMAHSGHPKCMNYATPSRRVSDMIRTCGSLGRNRRRHERLSHNGNDGA